MRQAQRLLIIGLIGLLVGCASATPDNPDPYESFNRATYRMNKKLDTAILKPIAKGYRKVTPDAVEKGVSNFFSNLGDVPVLVNDLLQFEMKRAAVDVGRLVVNTTIGFLGLVDVGTDIGLEKNHADFGLTFAKWGYKNSAYLMLPFLGPSTVRDGIGRGMGYYFVNPISEIKPQDTRRALRILDLVSERANLLHAEKVVGVAALDEYLFIRNAYLQRRQFLQGGDDSWQDDEFADETDDTADEE